MRRLTYFLRAVRKVLRTRLKGEGPFFVSHLITARCFARCPTCLWRGDVPEEKDVSKVLKFYREAREEGFVSTTFWGGEPLLWEGLLEVMEGCRKMGFVTGLITNGYLLPRYARDLAHLADFVIVSVDLPSEEHDRLRGVEGMFRRALEGISLLSEENPGLKVFLNTVVSRLNFHAVEGMVELCEELGISVTFESVDEGEPQFRDGPRVEGLRLPREEEAEVFGRIRRMKREGRPVNNSESYLRMFEEGRVRYRCHLPSISVRVEPDGNVTNCLDRKHPLGNVYRDRLRDILEGERMRWLRREALGCHRCVDTGTVESSLFWEFKPEVVLNTLRLFLG